MSLGFNPNRRHTSATLPGDVNFVKSYVRRARPTVRNNRSPVTSTVASEETIATNDDVKPVLSIQRHEQEHWIYASVGSMGLKTSETNETIVDPGTRIMLVYPMTSDPTTGMVSMKMKYVDSVTGQLMMKWVRVYDPNSDERFVSDFSLVP